MIYLDHAATTPLDPRVREAMLPWLDCANPSSQHKLGRDARMAIDEAREQVAEAMGCLPGEVIFTSSGTEACVLAIIGAAKQNLSDSLSENPDNRSENPLAAAQDPNRRLSESPSPTAHDPTSRPLRRWGRLGGGRHRILIGAAEHHAVLHCEKQLRELGYEVDFIPVTTAGAMDVSRLEVTDEVLLVCAMHANNETGAVTDVDAVAEKSKAAGALFFCDAVQSFGKLPMPDADLVAVSAHKIYGPKGVGALKIRAGVKIQPLMAGGGQEREMRGGTENVAAIVGFGTACQNRPTSLTGPKTAFREEVKRLIPSAIFTAEDAPCLPSHAHLRIPGASAEVVLINLDRLGVAASSGAACSSGSVEPSHVLLATGLDETEAAEGLRFSFGKDTGEDEARKAAGLLARAAGME